MPQLDNMKTINGINWINFNCFQTGSWLLIQDSGAEATKSLANWRVTAAAAGCAPTPNYTLTA